MLLIGSRRQAALAATVDAVLCSIEVVFYFTSRQFECLRLPFIDCTPAGKAEDFMAAAKLLHRAGRTVKVPTYLVPATQKVGTAVLRSLYPLLS